MNEKLIAQQPKKLLRFHLKSPTFDDIKLKHIDTNDLHLKIILTNKTDQLKLVYEHFGSIPPGRVCHLRSSAKTARHDLIKMEKETTQIQKRDAYFFYKVHNSEFINWYDSLSPLKYIADLENLEHHLFMTNDKVLEVLTFDDPKIIIDEIE